MHARRTRVIHTSQFPCVAGHRKKRGNPARWPMRQKKHSHSDSLCFAFARGASLNDKADRLERPSVCDRETCRWSPSVRFRSADSSRFRMLYSIRNPDVSDTLDPSKTLPVPHPASRKIIAANIQMPAVTFRLDCRAVLLCINAHASFPSSSAASFQNDAALPRPSALG